MTTWRQIIGWGVLCGLAVVGPARGAEFNMDVKADGINLGRPVMGPKVSPGDLKGRVVLLEFWGINCGPCLTSLPNLARWNQELSDFGLVTIGAHAQKGTSEEIQVKARSLGVNFAVVASASVREGNDFSGIPHTMLFDHTGKCLYRGSPGSVEGLLRAAVGKAIVEGTEKVTFTKAMAPLVEALKKGQSPRLVLQKVIPLQKSPDAATADEAKLLTRQLTKGGQRQVEEAESLMKSDVLTAYDQLQRLPLVFKGTAVETKANALLAELKKDKGVMAEVKARPSLDKVKKLDAQLSARAAAVDPKGADFQKAFAPVLKQLQTTLQQMKSSWPEAKATQEAVAIGEKYGIRLR